MDGSVHIPEIYYSGYHLGISQVFNGILEMYLSLQHIPQSFPLMNLHLEKTGICVKLDYMYSRLCLNPYLSVDTKKYGLSQSMGFGRAHPRAIFWVI